MTTAAWVLAAAALLGPGPLALPIDGVVAADLRNSFDEPRGSGRHEAIDIHAPRGTPVRAVADGRVVKLFVSKPGGLTVYQFDASERYAYYYAHLDRYAPGLREGQRLRRGDVLGTVGTTGNAAPEAPHLHFAVFELGPGREWWKGTPLDPYPLFVP
jgi:peptidoglycan LD-endopeptidase LytH